MPGLRLLELFGDARRAKLWLSDHTRFNLQSRCLMTHIRTRQGQDIQFS
jgi:hypothetical protein